MMYFRCSLLQLFGNSEHSHRKKTIKFFYNGVTVTHKEMRRTKSVTKNRVVQLKMETHIDFLEF